MKHVCIPPQSTSAESHDTMPKTPVWQVRINGKSYRQILDPSLKRQHHTPERHHEQDILPQETFH